MFSYKSLKSWKMTSGIISLLIALYIFHQSNQLRTLERLANAFGADVGSGGAQGFLVAVLTIVAGIISISTHKDSDTSGYSATSFLYGFAFVVGFFFSGYFTDLKILSIWMLICAIVNRIAYSKVKKQMDLEEKQKLEQQSLTQVNPQENGNNYL